MGDFLRVSTVQVVQAVDLAELDKTIRWLVSKVQELPTADQASQKTIADSLLQDQIDALRRENNSLKDALAQLQSKQEDIVSQLDTKQDRDQTPPAAAESEAAAASSSADADASPTSTNAGSVEELERRLAALEQRVDTLPSQPATAEPEDEAPEPAGPSGPDLNSQFQELLAGHRALAATVSGLQHELESKPNRGELDLKANRSELDALLRAGVSMTQAGDVPPPTLKVAADGSVDNAALVEAVNKAAGEVAGMRGLVAVLQDRIQGKAEQGGLEDLATQLAALKSKVPSSRSLSSAPVEAEAAQRTATPPAAAALAATTSEAEPNNAALDDLMKRVEELEVRVAAGASGAPTSSVAGVSADQAVDAIDSLTDVQPLLKDIYGRLDGKADRTALEDALRRLQDLSSALDAKADASALKDAADRLEQSIAAVVPAAAPVASASAPAGEKPSSASPRSRSLSPQQSQKTQPTNSPSQQQWIVSHELPPDHGMAALDELRAQVATLAGRVSQLAVVEASAAPHTPPVPPLASRASASGPELDLSNVQGALAALQGQLGELGTRLAGKADAGEVARLELVLNSKADVDELADIRLALGGKADAAALNDLQMAVAGKADQAALDEVKLTAALAADLAAGAGGDVGADGQSSAGGGGYTNLLGAINGMVSDKASKAELVVLQEQLAGKASADDVALLRAALDDKASAAELAALISQLSGRAANSEEIVSLDQRMGDVFAELAKIRADVAALPAEAIASAAAGGSPGRESSDSAGLQRMVSALNREVGSLREGLDTVAHAANVLAVGLDGSVRMSATGGVEGRYSEADGATGKENRSPRGGYERLVKLLGSGDYRLKMDAFDPSALQQMAQKLAYLEATVKSPAMGRPGVDHGIKELERQVKRLGTDVRLMKDKLIEPVAAAAAAMGISGSRITPGDHAMLAARPITGYRCMACDRPLDQLDTTPGPHIPTQQLPVRATVAPDTGRSQVRSGRGDPLSPQASSQKLVYNNDPNVRGVQNWYKDTQVVAAEILPREHVGPHLPPGGWRPSNPGTVSKLPGAQGNLPSLNGPKSRASPTVPEYEPRSQPAPAVPMDGVAANVTLPQIS